MACVLHLHELLSDFQAARSVRQLVGDLDSGIESVTRSIGHGGDFRHVADAVVGLRRMRSRPVEIIHAWGWRALSAAAMAGWGKIVISPSPEISHRGIGWLNMLISHRSLEVVCATSTQQRTLVERGVPQGHCHLIHPGADFSLLHRRRNPELRAQLGFAENDFVLLAVGESTHGSTHRLGVWAAGILNEMDRRMKILAWGRGNAADQTERFAGRLLQNGLFTSAERHLGRPVEFEELITVADAGLITASSPVATLPIAICMAGGLPIISTVTHTSAELLEDRRTALMVSKTSPRALAERVIDLRQNNELRWRISDAAQAQAREQFSLQQFLDRWRKTYGQIIAGKHVKLTESAITVPPPTGHG